MIEQTEAGSFLARLREAFLAPRRSMRRGLDENWGEGVRWLLVAAGGLVNTLVFRLLLAASPEMTAMLAPMGMSGFYFSLVLATLLQYGLVSGLILLAGQITGGAANAAQVRSVSAWWLFITSLLTPLSLIPFPLLSLVVFVANFALLSAYVSEAQGYRNIGAVMATISGVALFIGMLMLSVLAGVPAP